MSKRFFKRLVATAAALLLTLSCMLPAFATSVGQTGPVVNVIEKQSDIVLHLYNANSASKPGTGAELGAGDLPTGAEPIANATFAYGKVGEIVQYSAGSNVEIRYQIAKTSPLAGEKLLNIKPSDAGVETDEDNYYIEPHVLVKKLSDRLTATGDAVDDFTREAYPLCMTDGKVNETGKTDANGTVTVSVKGGLYLFLHDHVENAVTKVSPFLVAAPMPDPNSKGWNNAIHVYPKVRMGDVTFTKTAQQGGHEPQNDILVESVEPITYTVSLTLPGQKTEGGEAVGHIAYYQYLEVKDKMGPGLKPLVGASSLTAQVAGKDPIKLTTKDVTITPPDEDNKLTTTLEFAKGDEKAPENEKIGLAKLHSLLKEGDVTLTLTYKAYLSDGASLGCLANSNTATLSYERLGDDVVKQAEDNANVYTSGLDVIKVLSDGADVAGKGVTFKLKETEGAEGKALKFTKTDSGYWLVPETAGNAEEATNGENAEFADIVENAVEELVVDGTPLKIYGLLPGTYYLEETKTAQGYTKLDKDIEIVITEPDGALSTNNATATADGQKMQTNDYNAFLLTVVNTAQSTGFTLPKTGGEGMLAALAVGFALVGFAVLALVKAMADKKANEAEK